MPESTVSIYPWICIENTRYDLFPPLHERHHYLCEWYRIYQLPTCQRQIHILIPDNKADEILTQVLVKSIGGSSDCIHLNDGVLVPWQRHLRLVM